jgi:hypothetical protein
MEKHMASQSRRILDSRTMAASEKQPAAEVADFGAYRVLEMQIRVPKAGTGGNLQLQHAAVNSEDSWQNLGAAIALNATSITFTTVSDFLRYVRWTSDAGVAGSPVANVDVIAKE